MAMKYDPIMCMMVNDSVKSNDNKTVDSSFNVVYKSSTGTMQALVMAANEKEAEQKVRSCEGSKFVSLIGVKKMSDSNTLDRAIRNCDDLKSDKEKALEEYKEAKKEYEKVSANAKSLEEFKSLINTPEFIKFMEKKNVCMKLGCRI